MSCLVVDKLLELQTASALSRWSRDKCRRHHNTYWTPHMSLVSQKSSSSLHRNRLAVVILVIRSASIIHRIGYYFIHVLPVPLTLFPDSPINMFVKFCLPSLHIENRQQIMQTSLLLTATMNSLWNSFYLLLSYSKGTTEFVASFDYLDVHCVGTEIAHLS